MRAGMAKEENLLDGICANFLISEIRRNKLDIFKNIEKNLNLLF